jgi:hypothetical protein
LFRIVAWGVLAVLTSLLTPRKRTAKID